LPERLAEHGHLRTDYNLVYQQAPTRWVTASWRCTATRFKGGITSISATRRRVPGRAQRSVVVLASGGGFSEGYLYQEMRRAGLRFPPNDPIRKKPARRWSTAGDQPGAATVKHYLVVWYRPARARMRRTSSTRQEGVEVCLWLDEFVSLDTVRKHRRRIRTLRSVRMRMDWRRCCGAK